MANPSPAKSMGDPGITPLSPSHIQVTQLSNFCAILSLYCAVCGYRACLICPGQNSIVLSIVISPGLVFSLKSVMGSVCTHKEERDFPNLENFPNE